MGELKQADKEMFDKIQKNPCIEHTIENAVEIQKTVEVGNEKEYEDNINENTQRRSIRLQNKPAISYKEYDECYNACVQCVSYDIPKNYDDIKNHPNKDEWEKAIIEELNSLNENKTWSLVPWTNDKNIVDCRWVFVIKDKGDNSPPKFKARLVAKGFSQQYNVDYYETFAPVARMTTFRIMLAFANQNDLKIHQMDVKTAFLNGKLDEDIYMKVPEGVKNVKNHVCKLNKAIYGLKQAARCWYQRFDQTLRKYGFISSAVDKCLYILDKHDIQQNIYLLLYVDDILIFTYNDEVLSKTKKYLMNNFAMTDMHEIKTFLGINIVRKNNKIMINQKNYLKKVLAKFNMTDCNGVKNPLQDKLNFEKINSNVACDAPCRELIGCLMYAMLCSRPDLCVSIGILSRYQNKNNLELWACLKRVLRYIKETINLTLVYKKNINFEHALIGYVDSDWAGDAIDRKSTTGYIFKMYENCVVSWNTKKQNSVASSSTEAEYMALYEGVKEACWLKSLLESIKFDIKDPIPIFEDNNGCIAIANNPTDHKRTKHIDVKYHFTREKVEQKFILIKSISTDDQIADAFTKPLATPRFLKLRNEMGLNEEEEMELL